MMEKRGRSPSLRRKNSIESQQSRIPDLHSVLEQKKLLSSAELKKIPIYSKHTVSSILYAQNVKRPHSFDKPKSPRRSVDKPPIGLSKIMPAKTKSNEDNLSSSYTKPSSPKPEDAKKPNVMENNVRKQEDNAEKKLRFREDVLSSKDNHSLTTYESNDVIIVDDRDIIQHLAEDLHGEMESRKGDKILQCELLVPMCEDADMPHQSNTCSPDTVMVVESVNNEHLNDQDDETFDVRGDHFNVDKENQKAENGQVTQEAEMGSKDVEERGRKQAQVKEGGNEAPNKEDVISKMVVAYQRVVTHGNKDAAAYNNVTEETISKLREKRSNKVKALVGAFESVISHESDVLPKGLLRTHQ